MPTTITLPEKLASDLQSEANNRRLSLDKLVVDILAGALARSGGWFYREPVAEAEEEIPEFWKLARAEPIPEPPPPTPEGDEIALEAVEWIRGRFPITDPEEARWIAESEEAAIYNAYLFYELEDTEE